MKLKEANKLVAFVFLLGLLSCKSEEPYGRDAIKRWNSDSTGCLYRSIETFKEIDSLKVLNDKDTSYIIEILGRPDRILLFEDSVFVYLYYLGKNCTVDSLTANCYARFQFSNNKSGSFSILCK